MRTNPFALALLGLVVAPPALAQRLELDPLTSRADGLASAEPRGFTLSAEALGAWDRCLGGSSRNDPGLQQRWSVELSLDTTLFEEDFESGTLDAWSSVFAPMCPVAPTNLMGCAACASSCNPDPWNVSWAAVTGATHYIVEYTCFTSTATYQTANTTADLCVEVGMCDDDSCASGAGAVKVQACDAACCSPKVTFSPNETPIACGGGVCC